MKLILTAVMLLALISPARAADPPPKAAGRPLRLTVRMLELPKREPGKEQTKFRVFDHDILVRENEQFRAGDGISRGFKDSEGSVEIGDWTEGKVKLSDRQKAVVDLKVTVTQGTLEAQPSGDVLVAGLQYQVHSALKLGEPRVFMLTKPGDGRPRWLEIVVTHNDR